MMMSEVALTVVPKTMECAAASCFTRKVREPLCVLLDAVVVAVAASELDVAVPAFQAVGSPMALAALCSACILALMPW